jgi:hypothetical protein
MNISRKGNEKRSYEQHRIDCAEKFINEFLPSMVSKSKTTNAPPEIMKKIKENRHNPAMLPVLNAEFEIIVNNAHTQIENYQKDLLTKAQQIHGPDFQLPERRNVLSLIDISGSMEAPASTKSKSKLSCMDVSISLGYLTARMNRGPYKNLAISFSEQPHIINFNKPNDETMNAQEAYNEIHKHCGYTTDIIKAYQLILDIATTNNVPQEEIPDIAVFSDMGFDSQMISNDPGFRRNYSSSSYSWYSRNTQETSNNYEKYWATTHETVTKMFQEHGYEAPQMYYVDLNANSYDYHNQDTDGGFQAQATRKGVSQMRGYTQSLFQFIMTGSLVLATVPNTDTNTETSTKEQQEQILAQKKSTLDDFLGMVNKTLYDPIRLMCSNELSEKQLANYQWTPPSIPEQVPTGEQSTTDTVMDDGFEVLENTTDFPVAPMPFN